jgi:hypothetical protein
MKPRNKLVLGTISVLVVLATAMMAVTCITQAVYAFSCRDFPDAPIAASADNVYVTWVTNKTGNWEVMFRASNDSGKIFADKINLSQSPNANSFHPNVAASGKNVYVSLHDAKSGNLDTYVRTSADGGKTFGPLINIKGTGAMPQQSDVLSDPKFIKDAIENTEIAASGNNVYVVSWDKKTGNWEVFISASNDNGKTFGDTINLSNTPDQKSDKAWLTAEGNNAYVSWWETHKDGTQEPVIRVSNDAGQSFGPMLKLSTNGAIGSSK